MASTYQQSSGTHILDWDGTFFKGSKSDCDPAQLPLGYFWNGINVINLGGVIACRPGYECKLIWPDGNLQGAMLFRPVVGVEQIICVIDGKVYVTPYPFEIFHQLEGLQFLPSAKQVYFELTFQSAERITPDLGGAIRVIPTKAVVFIQDGGFTAPAWYDANSFGHVRGADFDTPAGSDMCWVGDRLWVAYRNQVVASDISNPFSFRENIYLGGKTAFFFASTVVALAKTPSIESPQLLVLTEEDGSLLRADIRERAQWAVTQDFQKEIIQVGCASKRSVVSHAGNLVWMSTSGIVVFDPATIGKLTSRLPIRDNEMLISKVRLNGDLDLVASGTFGQFLLVSVPADDIYNRHTWIMNQASFESLNDDSGPCWSGYWLGTRPVQWLAGKVAGVDKIYHISVDYDGKNRLWEAFIPNQLDNGCPITWAVESRGMFGQTSGTPAKYPGSICRFLWSDIALSAIAEPLDIGVFYAGGTRGAYKPILTKKLSVERGTLFADQILTADSILFGFKPQSRILRTEDANQQITDPALASCAVERLDNENVDESFQLLVVGHGPATIRWLKSFGLSVPEKMSGDSQACEDELGINAVRFDGVGSHTKDVDTAIANLTFPKEQQYFASATEFLESGGFSAVGTWSMSSVVSQRAVNRVSTIVATQQAEAELYAFLPKTLSTAIE